MKKWFIDKFPGFIAITLIGYSCYNAGYGKARYDIMVSVDYCSKQLPDKDMSTFYKHTWKGNPKTIYPHAEAFTEMIFAKCIRKEINK